MPAAQRRVPVGAKAGSGAGGGKGGLSVFREASSGGGAGGQKAKSKPQQAMKDAAALQVRVR
jgi:hypothetical protein